MIFKMNGLFLLDKWEKQVTALAAYTLSDPWLKFWRLRLCLRTMSRNSKRWRLEWKCQRDVYAGTACEDLKPTDDHLLEANIEMNSFTLISRSTQ
jgi:hypothetical protein